MKENFEYEYEFCYRPKNIHGEETKEVRVRSNAVTINELVEDFDAFLRGCPFYFHGHVGIVEEGE